MEVAAIDWTDSEFQKDELYEDINAPQWIDLSANHLLHNDEAWFCRPDCNHPKTVDDFFMKTIPNPSKHQRSANVSEISRPDDRNQSNTSVKKRGTPKNKISRITKQVQDNENQNPNFLTSIESSVEKKKADNSSSLREETPRRLKTTSSARNLFAGNNILNQITEFCNELKRLATRTKHREDEHGGEKQILQKKPLLEATKVKHGDVDNNSSNGKQKVRTKIRNDGLENRPIAENTKNTRVNDDERVLQIRTTKGFPA